jgi:hypothetical protein
MLNKQDLLALAKTVARADKSAPTAYSFKGENFSYEALTETLRKEFNEYASTYRDYKSNQNLIFSVIEETLDDILPKKVEEAYSMFAEVKTFKQGDKPLFRRKISARNRAKQFITRVGLAGIYEVFKLGGEESFEVQTSAIGGAAQIGFEEFLDGRVDFAEVTAIVMEGMDELIYHEIGAALIAAIDQLPLANRYVADGFNEVAFDRAVAVASAYGEPTIYCSYDFAVKMIPSKQWMYTDAMKTELWNNGHFTNYKGKKVIILPNGFVDETNATRSVDPGYCWIIPSGGDNKPVKVAFEGQTIVDEYVNADRSREIQVYKKVGVIALMTNNIVSYKDTSLAGKVSLKDYSPSAAYAGVAAN